MSQQEIECSTDCKGIGLNTEKKEKTQNRITIDQIPNKGLSNCYCQLSKGQKSKQCQSMGKCKYILANEENQLLDLTLYKFFNDISNSPSSIEAIAYKKIIHCIRDFNSIKDQNAELNLKLKLINKALELDDQFQDQEPIEESYPKLAAELKDSPQDFKNNCFIRFAISLQEQIDQILDGEETFFFFFFKQGLDCSIQKSIQFLQRANQREIEYLEGTSGCTSVSKLKSDSYKISLISIQKKKLDFEPLKKENLQLFNFYLADCQDQERKVINTSNINYNIPIENSLESLKVALKFFVKEKLKEFKPHIIIFFFEISNTLIKDPQVFYKLVKSFHKITQGRLIIVPQIDPQFQFNKSEIIQLYINCTNNCFLGCLRNQNTQKLDQNSIIQYYEQLYPYFVEANNQKKQQYYRNQLKSLQIQRQQINEKQSRQNLQKEFPLIDKEGNLVLLELGQEFDFTHTQYFVEYDDNNNGEYDGYIIFIQSKRVQVVYFSEQSQSKNSKLSILKIYQFPLPQNLNGVYFYDSEQKVLIYFFGYTETAEFSSEIQFLEISNQMAEWHIVKYQPQQKRVDDGSYSNPQQIINLIKCRSQFSVTKNRIDGYNCMESNSYVCIGGTYYSDKYNYGCIIQEVVIEFKQKVYSTNIVEKSKIDKFYKECPNPLLIRLNDAFVLYFEKNGSFNVNNNNPSIVKLCFWKSRQHLIQNNKINFKDSKTQHWFLQLHQYLSSNHINIRMCQGDLQVENLSRFRILIEEQSHLKQSQLIENKITLRRYFILTVSFFSLRNEIHIDCKQFQVNSHSFLKSIQDLQREERQELYQNSIENLKNTFIFHYKEYDHQYLLCYIDETKNVVFKRFVFYDLKTQDNDDFRDYQELIYQDWAFSKIYLIRKQITLNDCQLRIYECHHIHFSDIKDSSDDILHQVPIHQIYLISDFKSTYQLIGFHVEIKNDENFEGLVLTNKNQYQIVNQKKTITHTQTKLSKPLNVNTQQKFLFLKSKSSYYLFYKKLQFQQASVKNVSQNIIEIRYLFLDQTFQVLSGNTLLCSLNEPLPIFGPLDGLINTIKLQENLMEMQVLINSNTTIFKSSIICRVNQETNKLDQLNVNSQTPSKNEGFNMFPSIQSNRKKGDYIVKQSKDHSKICCE
ncbi:unnamed protein product (macronuclear) [Paramecium tetraurelia]|uniref:Uncharacterized protein n=1 Tax=Paramecium tetraurelia TaxID=5888 RepID=A0D7J5_PARTE|nr:uncharacterized protein GSPATT00002054001 [Paramecium tetraurelia]CAK79012.1 unnamed protein product [Paramecium tetraurelia]|eukprot:XP_001446409.1 hypothetical protein (macronuclear) [Paramecium tetraurelia strain d4-2]